MKDWMLATLLALAAVSAQGHDKDRASACDQRAGAGPEQTAFDAAGQVSVYSKAERACWADWPQAQALAAGPTGLWIDVRDVGERHRLGLPGAVVLDPADVPGKTFLQGQSLVLVGTGVDLKLLSSHCVALRQSGRFKDVHVLLHGVRSWRAAGQTVQVQGAVLAPDEISPRELWLGAADGLWRIVTIGLTQEQSEDLAVPVALTASDADLEQALSALHAQAGRAIAREPQQRWLVVAGTDKQLARARALWRTRFAQTAPAALQPLWLAGAWPAYADYLRQQRILAAHAGQPLPRLCGI